MKSHPDTKRNYSLWVWLILVLIILAFFFWLKPLYKEYRDDFSLAHARYTGALLSSSSAVNFTKRRYKVGVSVPVEACEDVSKIPNNELITGYSVEPRALEANKIHVCQLNTDRVHGLDFTVLSVK